MNPVEVPGPEGKSKDRLVSGSGLFRLSFSFSDRPDPPHKSTKSCTELCLRFGFGLASAFFRPLLLNSFRVPNPPSGSSGPSSLLTDPTDDFRDRRPFGMEGLIGLQLSDNPLPFAVTSPFASGKRAPLLVPVLIGRTAEEVEELRAPGSADSGRTICSTFPSRGCAMRWGLFSMKEARLLGDSRNTGSPEFPPTPGIVPAEVLKRDRMSAFSWSSPVSQSREGEEVAAVEGRDKRPARESVASFRLL